MIIIIALILHKIGHYLPLWVKREKVENIRNRFNYMRFFFEMNGVIMNLVVAFIIILIITMNSNEKYLLNENAIFGIQVSESAKKLGFENGDKIISINGEKVELFSDIMKSIRFKII